MLLAFEVKPSARAEARPRAGGFASKMAHSLAGYWWASLFPCKWEPLHRAAWVSSQHGSYE